MFDITITSYVRNLNNLKNILAKAKVWQEEKKINEDVLVGARLTLDQFPLSRQVQMMCDFAKKSGALLSGVEIPMFPDTEKTIDELVGRIDKTLAFLATLPKDVVAPGLETKMIPMPWTPGKGLTAKYYIESYALPQFYFHYTTAYSILRHHGLAIGKGDYMGVVDLKDIA